jgi:hypothetical protein
MMRMRTTTVTTLDTSTDGDGDGRAPGTSRARVVFVACLFAGLAPACHAEVHASTAGDANASAKTDEPEMTVTETQAAPAPTTQAAAAAPEAPPPDACPLHCYAAWGAYRTDVTSGELSQLASALEPALSRMRACAGAEGTQTWRRRGSPVLQLRVEPDGMVHEIDVDPHHSYEHARSCIDDAARETNISLAMPGRKTVRCNERCETPRSARGRRR